MPTAENLQLRTFMARQFLGSLLATPRGRSFVLTQAGIAESTDEGEVFEQLRTRVGDEELARLVSWHAKDEERHAKVFLAAADRQGVGRPQIPEDTQVLALLNARIGVFGRPLAERRDIMDAYLVLQVIEERAIEQFSILEPVMRRFDPVTADEMREIEKDEQRHLRYCHAITRRYAPSEAVRTQRLHAFRVAEAKAFREHQQNGLAFILSQKYLPAGVAFFWKNAAGLFGTGSALPFTRHYLADQNVSQGFEQAA
ncbi:MAG: ferritin-like domain-containing protein [Polyangiaceae bacterium]